MGTYVDEIANTDLKDLRFDVSKRSKEDILKIIKNKLRDNTFRFNEQKDYLEIGYTNENFLSLGKSWEPDSIYVRFPSVIKDGDKYKVWYSVHDGHHWRIAYMESYDFIKWTKFGVVLPEDSVTRDLTRSAVIKDGSLYRIWYSGTNQPNYRIYYATSTDGITWDKHGLVMDLGDAGYPDDQQMYVSNVIKDGSIYRMVYIGNHNKILYAESSDGITWTKKGGKNCSNLTYCSIIDKTTSSLSFIRENGIFKLIFVISEWVVTYESSDCINWVRNTNKNINNTVKISNNVFVCDGVYRFFYTINKYIPRPLTKMGVTTIHNYEQLNNLYNYGNYNLVTEEPSGNIFLRKHYGGYSSVTTLVGECNDNFYLKKGWENIRTTINIIDNGLVLSRKPKSIKKVIITKKDLTTLEASYTLNTNINAIVVNNTFSELGYNNELDMKINIHILVYYIAYAKGDYDCNLKNPIANDNTVTITGNNNYENLSEIVLNQSQVNSDKQGSTELSIIKNGTNTFYSLPKLTHSPIHDINKDYYKNTMLKFYTYLINNNNQNVALNVLYQEVTNYLDSTSIHPGIDVGMVFGNNGDTLYNYGVIQDLGHGNDKDSDGVGPMTLLYDETSYKIWYTGYYLPDWRIIYTESNNGLDWSYNTDSSDRWVSIDIERNTADTDNLEPHTPTVILDGDTYKMWYGVNVDSHWSIYYATSTDGITWDKHGKVLPYGAAGTFDAWYAMNPCVIKDGTTYKMWYTAQNDQDSINNLAYATSTDGISWDKHGVIIEPGNDLGITTMMLDYPHVIKDGNIYRIWYSGKEVNNYNYYGLYAESSDGITWTKKGVILNPGASGVTDEWGIYKMFVLKDGNNYRIWYSGKGYGGMRMHYASTDHIDVPLIKGWVDDNVLTSNQKSEVITTINLDNNIINKGVITIPLQYLTD